MGDNTKVFNSTRDEILFLDKIDVHGVHCLDGGLQLESDTYRWYAEPLAIGLGYVTRETHGHQRETSTDDGEILASE